MTSVAWTFSPGVRVGPIPRLPSAGTVRRVGRVRRPAPVVVAADRSPTPPQGERVLAPTYAATVPTVLCSSTDPSSAQPAPSAGASRVRTVRDDAPECVKGSRPAAASVRRRLQPRPGQDPRGRDGRATRTGRRGRCRHRRGGVTSTRHLPVCPDRPRAGRGARPFGSRRTGLGWPSLSISHSPVAICRSWTVSRFEKVGRSVAANGDFLDRRAAELRSVLRRGRLHLLAGRRPDTAPSSAAGLTRTAPSAWNQPARPSASALLDSMHPGRLHEPPFDRPFSRIAIGATEHRTIAGRRRRQRRPLGAASPAHETSGVVVRPGVAVAQWRCAGTPRPLRNVAAISRVAASAPRG